MSKAEFQDQLQHQRAKWTVEFGVDTSWEHHVAFSVLMLHSPEGQEMVNCPNKRVRNSRLLGRRVVAVGSGPIEKDSQWL